MVLTGRFNQQGHPLFPIRLFGFSPQTTIDLVAMFDTGFTGFLNLPLPQCLQSALILHSTAQYTLADKSLNTTLLCLGTIVLPPDRNVVGAISISFSSNEALLGMEFLHKIKGKLHVDTAGGLATIEYGENP